MRESSLDYHGKLYHFGELIWLQHAVDQLVHDIRLTHTHTEQEILSEETIGTEETVCESRRERLEGE